MPRVSVYFINIFCGCKSNSFIFVLAGEGAVEAASIGKQSGNKYNQRVTGFDDGSWNPSCTTYSLVTRELTFLSLLFLV